MEVTLFSQSANCYISLAVKPLVNKPLRSRQFGLRLRIKRGPLGITRSPDWPVRPGISSTMINVTPWYHVRRDFMHVISKSTNLFPKILGGIQQYKLTHSGILADWTYYNGWLDINSLLFYNKQLFYQSHHTVTPHMLNNSSFQSCFMNRTNGYLRLGMD